MPTEVLMTETEEMRYYLNLCENIILNELTDKVKQQQLERFKKEREKKIKELSDEYEYIVNEISNLKATTLNSDYANYDRKKHNELEKRKKSITKEIQDYKENITDEKINLYIKLYDEYSQGFPKEFKDITKLSLKQLISLTRDADFKKYIRGKKSHFFTNNDPNPELDTIYNKNNLVIMKGDLKEKCIQYGDGYSWCISRKDANNMFFSYRMRLNEPAFYFVFDKDKPKKHKYHAVVIYVDNKNDFYLSNAFNEENLNISWEEIVNKIPKLKDLKKLFKHKPLSKSEREDYEKYKRRVDDETYNKFTLEEKYKYFKFGNSLTDKQQDMTPDDLIRVYAKHFPTNISPNTWNNRLKSGDKRKIIQDVIDEQNTAADATKFAEVTLQKSWQNTNLPQDMIDKAHKKISKNNYEAKDYAILLYNNSEEIPEIILNSIAESPINSYDYAIYILRREGEEKIPDRIIKGIAKDANSSYKYAEELIIQNNGDINSIPDIIIKGIAKHPKFSYYYIFNLIQEDEKYIENIPDILLESISQKSYYSLNYATEILKKYNEEGINIIPEKIIKSISTESLNSFKFANIILKITNNDINKIPKIIISGIAKNPQNAYTYVKRIMKIKDNNKIPKEIIDSIKKDKNTNKQLSMDMNRKIFN